MKTMCISRAVMRYILMCVIAAGVMFAYSGLAPADTKTAYADSNTDMRAVIEDQKLYEVLQVLANYEKENNQSFYAGVAGSYSKDITGMDEAKPYLAQPLTQETLEAYDDEVNLAPYGELTTLDGLNSAKGVTKLVLPKTWKPVEESLPVPYSSIEAKSCYNMPDLKTVVMPESVTVIGNSAFEYCSSLKTITYPGEYSGSYSPAEEEANLNLKKVNVIGDAAFASCFDIKHVDLLGYEGMGEDETIDIKANAFASCTSLESISVPKGTMGNAVFSGCTNLASVTFDNSYEAIPNSTLASVRPAGGVNISFPSNLKTIGSYAFSNCVVGTTNLSDCTQLSKIDDFAFQNAVLSGWVCDLGSTALDSIGDEAFEGVILNSTNGEVVLPKDMTKMGVAAFAMTRRLTSVKLPTAMDKIPAGAFLYSYELESITSYGETSIETIGDHAFDMCGHLPNLSFFNNYCPYLKSIGDYAFARCIPAKADYVDEEEGDNFGLNSIVLNDTVTTIGKYAFKDDFGITSADLGNGVNDIPEGLICCGNTNSINSKNIAFEDVVLDTEDGGTITFPFTADEQAYNNIRDAYSVYPKALSKLSVLSDVTISKNSKTIGKKAFSGNPSLEKLTYDEDPVEGIGVHIPTGVESIGEHAFSYCSAVSGSGKNRNLTVVGISNVIMPSTVKTLGEYAFAYNPNLNEVTLPEGIETIPAYCFDSCGYDDEYNNKHHYCKEDYAGEGDEPYEPEYNGGLTIIGNYDSIKTIGNYAFRNCYMLSKIKTSNGEEKDFAFTSSLESLGEYAFAGTAINNKMNLMNTGIKVLQKGSFENCRNITEVNCPDSLEEIKEDAFKYSTNMSKLSFPVYTSLSKKMLGERNRGPEMRATLGKYRDTTYIVPIGLMISLPANAFSGCNSEVFEQIYPGDPDHPVRLDQADPKYFEVEHVGNSYNITGGKNEVEGTECRVSATLKFEDVSGTVPLSVTYPVDVKSVHAESINYKTGGFRLSSGTLGIIKEESGEQVLYVNSNYKGRELTITAEAFAGGENKGMITDAPEWSTDDSSVLRLKENTESEPNNQTKEPSKDVCNISAKFVIGNAGEANVTASFDDGSDDPFKTMKVKIIDPIQSIDYTVAALGDNHADPSKHTMRVGQKDKITATAEYKNDNDKRDHIYYSSDNEEVATVDNNGNINAVAEGKTNVRIKTATGSVTKTIEVTVVGTDEEVQPLYVDINGTIGEDGKAVCYVGEAAEFTATCYPSYATPNVSWTVSKPECVDLNTESGKAILTGTVANENISLTASANQGAVKKTQAVITRQKATALEFRETDPVVVIANKAASKMIMSSNQSQTDGLVRIPETTIDDVTFMSSDPTVVALGTNSGNCSSDPVTLKTSSASQTKNLYYKGLKAGTATITARSVHGKEATLKVKVIGNTVKSLTYKLDSMGDSFENLSALMMPVGQDDRITSELKYTNDGDIDDSVVYESDRNNIVTVDNEGRLKAVAPGEAIITIRNSARTISHKMTVKVKSNKDDVKPVSIESVNGPETTDGKGFVYVGESATFKANCLPKYASQKAQWTVNDSSAVTLSNTNGNAVLTGKVANKTVKLKATANTVSGNGTLTKSVVTRQKATGLLFRETPPYIGANDVKYLKLSSDQSQQKGIIRVPETAMDDVTFKSSNSSVLVLGDSVDSCTKGSVTLSGSSKNLYYKGLKDGTATIIATSAGGKTATLAVTVVGQPITGLSFAEDSITLMKGAKKIPALKKTPAGSTEKVTFESSNTSVAKVDASGTVTAVGPGSATIKAKSIINKAAAVCRINVPKPGATVDVDGNSYKVNSDNTLTFSKAKSGVKTLKILDAVTIEGNKYNVTSVAASACFGNSDVKKVIIGNKIVKIGNKAFMRCSALRTLIIGASVKTIGSKAYYDCTKLKNIKIKSKRIKKIGKAAFKNTHKKAKVKCPKKKKKIYKKKLRKAGLSKKAKVK